MNILSWDACIICDSLDDGMAGALLIEYKLFTQVWMSHYFGGNTVETDLGPLNICFASAWRKAAICEDWWHIVDMATFQRSVL